VSRGNANAFSIAEIGNIYRGVCGGSCNVPGQLHEVHWSDLTRIVDLIYGASSTKAIFWRSSGDLFGVDN
jgi:hypothetical protein